MRAVLARPGGETGSEKGVAADEIYYFGYGSLVNRDTRPPEERAAPARLAPRLGSPLGVAREPPDGIACARDRLAPGGVLGYWSATPDRRFAKRLRERGLHVSEKSVFAHGRKGTKHTIWLARR